LLAVDEVLALIGDVQTRDADRNIL
jgi:hypothetical protein